MTHTGSGVCIAAVHHQTPVAYLNAAGRPYPTPSIKPRLEVSEPTRFPPAFPFGALNTAGTGSIKPAGITAGGQVGLNYQINSRVDRGRGSGMGISPQLERQG